MKNNVVCCSLLIYRKLRGTAFGAKEKQVPNTSPKKYIRKNGESGFILIIHYLCVKKKIMELQKRDIKSLLTGVNKEIDSIMLATTFNEYYVKHSELTVRMRELIKSTGEVVDYDLEAPFSLTNYAIFAGISPYRLNKLIQTTSEAESPELYEVLSSIVEIIKNENLQGAMLGKYKESTVQKIHRLAEIVENNGRGNVQAINIDLGSGLIDLTE